MRRGRSGLPEVLHIISPAAGGLLPLGEDRHSHGLAGAVRQHDRAPHLLVGVTRIDSQLDVGFHGLVEVGRSHALQ